MSSRGPVTHWLRQLEAGDQDAAQPLWEVYFQRLVDLARQQLQNAPRQAADEEDVALSVFASFCRRAEKGACEDVGSSDSLWRLLVCITAHKAIDHARRERSLKRGGGRGGRAEVDLEQVVGSEPTPAFAAQVTEECQRLLAALPTDELRSLAVWRMEGWTIQEIADRLRRSVPTVNRKLDVIRQVWTAQDLPGERTEGREEDG
jgi:DNA-directed RNA polymerase specialized sigma24 family protein